MIVRHSLTVSALCPVDDLPDIYEMTVEASRVVMVEDIIAVAVSFAGRRIYQEDLTTEAARRLACKVTTIGFHSGVRTEVVA